MPLPLHLIPGLWFLALLQLLPEPLPLGIRFQLLLATLWSYKNCMLVQSEGIEPLMLKLTRLETGPHGQGDQALHLLATQLNLHAVEARIQEHEDGGQLLEVLRAHLLRLPQTNAHNLVEESWELRLIRSLEDVPSGDSFAALLVDHHDNRQSVGMGRLASNVIGPQVLLQVLAELENGNSPGRMFRLANLVLVDLLNDLRIVRLMVALRAGVPVLVGDLQRG